VLHYTFRGKIELPTAVVAAVTRQIENVLRDAIYPGAGLAAAIGYGLLRSGAKWSAILAHVIKSAMLLAGLEPFAQMR
jgi:hypothetical protein